MKVYKDFPKPGCDFLDINSELNDPFKLTELRDELLESLIEGPNSFYGKVDKVVAIESRGFLFGTSIAATLGAGLSLARKPGKLPGEVITQEYDTEYSTDSLQIQVDSIEIGDRVLIHDDVLATGGTAEAVARMVELIGGEVVGYSFIAEIMPLKGREKLQGAMISSLLKVGE